VLERDASVAEIGVFESKDLVTGSYVGPGHSAVGAEFHQFAQIADVVLDSAGDVRGEEEVELRGDDFD
jgi:hypothetical protein